MSAETALESSTAVGIASLWWAAVRRVWVSSDQRNALRASTGVETSAATSTAAFHRCVQRAFIVSGIFGNTDADVVFALIEHLQPVLFPAGHVVFAQGDAGSALFMVAAGKVKVAYRYADGREVVLNIVGTSEVFGEVTPFDCGTREVTATTLTEVCAVAIERDQLLAWMTEYPEITHQVLRLLARRADVMTNCMIDFVFADPPYRVARRLLLLGKRFGRRDGDVVRIQHDLTLDEISRFAGLAPKIVEATLLDFSDRGWIRLEGATIEIVDGQRLAGLPPRGHQGSTHG